MQTLADQQGILGPAGSVASTAPIWRVLNGIDAALLGEIRLARARRLRSPGLDAPAGVQAEPWSYRTQGRLDELSCTVPTAGPAASSQARR